MPLPFRRASKLRANEQRADEQRKEVKERCLSTVSDSSSNATMVLMTDESVRVVSPGDKENYANRSSGSSSDSKLNIINNNNNNNSSNDNNNHNTYNQITTNRNHHNSSSNSTAGEFVDGRGLEPGQIPGLAPGQGLLTLGFGQWPEQGQGLGLTVQYLTQQVMAAQQALHTVRQEREQERREREEERREREEERQEREEERRAAGDDAYNL